MLCFAASGTAKQVTDAQSATSSARAWGNPAASAVTLILPFLPVDLTTTSPLPSYSHI